MLIVILSINSLLLLVFNQLLSQLWFTLSALIPPALIPPHLANVAGLRAGGRKGRRKKGRRKKGQGTKKVSPASMLHFSVEFRLFLTN